jgi:hypothetical protein
MRTRLMDAVAVSFFLGPAVRHQTLEEQDRTSYERNSRLSEAEIEALYGNPFAVSPEPTVTAAPATTRPRRQMLPHAAGASSR